MTETGKYFLMFIKSPFQEQNKAGKFTWHYRPGEIYFVTAKSKLRYQQNLKNKHAEFFDIFKFFKRYDAQEKGNHTKIIIRSGGIGDIVALSTICHAIPGNIEFWTSDRMAPIFDWYEKPVRVKNFFDPLWRNIPWYNLNQLKNRYRIVDFTEMIENGSDRNWYDIFYEAINMPVGEKRPELVDVSELDDMDYLLICHRSTSAMRSASFQSIYEAVIKTKELDQYRPIAVHGITLTESDRKYIESLPAGSVEVLKADDTGEFIDQVRCAGMVISVDSAAIHIREGLKLPAIGIYNSFSAKCRTEGYKYTYSFDIMSRCPDQPCFLHQFQNGKIVNQCQHAEKGDPVAPCLTSKFTPDLEDQLTAEFEKAITIFQYATL